VVSVHFSWKSMITAVFIWLLQILVFEEKVTDI